MILNRRSMLYRTTMGVAALSMGCRQVNDSPCQLYYRNLSGRYLQGTVRIGESIGDSFGGSTFTSLPVSGRLAVVENKKCSFVGRDIFSTEHLEIESYIPAISLKLPNPKCIITIHDSRDITTEWIDLSESDLYAQALTDYNKSHQLVPCVFIGLNNYRSTEFGLRMRPHKFTTIRMVNSESRVGNTTHAFATWIASPSNSNSAVMTYQSTNLDTSELYHRFCIDFRNIPVLNRQSDGVWIELIDRKTLAIGRFPAKLSVSQELERALIDGVIRRPDSMVEFIGVPHPPLLVQQQERKDIIWVDPDLRFDDEIAAQGLESPVPF